MTFEKRFPIATYQAFILQLGERLFMEKILKQKIHTLGLGYTDYEIRVMIYAIKTILYEASKFIILAFFFAIQDRFPQFLVATICLMAVRSRSGGIHLKHYLSCFLMTFIAYYISVTLFPMLFHPSKYIMLAVLILCMVITYQSGPVLAVSRPKPDGIKVKAFKEQTATVIGMFAVLVVLIGENSYLESGFWIIVFQSVQLFIAKIKEVRQDEKIKHFEHEVVE